MPFLNLFISLIELKNIHEQRCKFKIDKTTYSKYSVEQRITLPRISLRFIFTHSLYQHQPTHTIIPIHQTCIISMFLVKSPLKEKNQCRDSWLCFSYLFVHAKKMSCEVVCFFNHLSKRFEVFTTSLVMSFLWKKGQKKHQIASQDHLKQFFLTLFIK